MEADGRMEHAPTQHPDLPCPPLRPGLWLGFDPAGGVLVRNGPTAEGQTGAVTSLRAVLHPSCKGEEAGYWDGGSQTLMRNGDISRKSLVFSPPMDKMSAS